MANLPDSRSLEKYKTVIVLRDGSNFHLRPATPRDEEKMLAFFQRLSRHSSYLRFHHVLSRLSKEEARRLCTVDYNDTFTLVATLGEDPDENIIAVGQFARLPGGDAAETALVVEDTYQKKGIGTHLLEQLARIARDKNIHHFEAEVLAENKNMLQVLTDSGFQMGTDLDYGIYRVYLDIPPVTIVDEWTAEREKVATVASLNSFIKPRSVAVIGASRREGSIGNKLFRNILYQGFNGVVYPVNPNSGVVAAVKAYPTVMDVPGDIDLAIIIVPAESVYQVAEECGKKGVRGIVTISAGFAESGPEGVERQKKLVKLAKNYGMRLVGPNCMGVINTEPKINLNGTFSAVFPPAGMVAMCTQSGALGLAILEYAKSLNIGLSSFVSIGNRADVSSNDLLQYWQEDPNTGVILLYLESFGNPRRFNRIAHSVIAKKPVVVVKSGRTPAGSRAAASHTGALATTEVASEALFRQSGVIRVDTLEELFDVANLLSHQPLPRGKRVAILTNGGGPGILAADACASRGLDIPVLKEETVKALKQVLPPNASLSNPIDMTAEASADEYRKCLEVLARDPEIDIVIVIFIPPIVTQPEAVASAICLITSELREKGKVIVASFMSLHGAPAELSAGGEQCVPSFTFPEQIATALAKAYEYSEWLKKPKGVIPKLEGINTGKARSVVKAALEKAPTRPFWLDTGTVSDLLNAYGISSIQSKLAAGPEEAVQSAREIGFPVAVKLSSPTITHKTEVGGVALNLNSPQEVKQAFHQIKEKLAVLGREDEMKGVVIQKMVPDGVELIIGVTQDPSFGPLLLFGMGGTYTELFKDVAVRIHPLTDIDASEMIRSVRTYQLLEGWRGAKPSDIKSIEDLLLRVSAMVEDIPEIVEIDLNPVKVQEREKGYLVVDARVMVA